MADPEIALAAIMGAHGIKGEVKLKLFAQSLDSLTAHRTVRAGDRTLTLQSAKPGRPVIARFAEIAERTEAERLRGTLITVDRAALPPLGPGEYYHADIIGLACVDAGGEPLGTVVGIENFGAGDVIEIERPNGKKAMVPFRETVADLVDGRIVVDPLFLA